MKHLLSLLLIFILGITSIVHAQLPDGSTAPNWTLTDIDGNTHTLYDYLDQGKMVILKFSATWCGPCWNYMLTGALETVWEEHGPAGDNTAMLFYIEADQNTGMADLLGNTGSSQGNWVEAIPFPIIDLQVGQNQDNQYQIGYYPTLYAVCSDYSIWELGQVPASTWSSFIQSCSLEGVVENVQEAVCFGEGSITVDYTGGVAPVTYEWSNGDNGPTTNNVGAGSYSVTITESGGKWVVLDNIIVGGADEPIALQQSTIEEPLCNGSSNGGIDIEMEGGTPGYGYDWSNGSSTEDLSNVSAGNYTVIVTDDNGCTFQQAFSMSEPDALEVESETTPENCDQEDGTVSLYIEGGTGDYLISASSGDIFGNQIINLSEGIVTATVEDDNGCIWEEDFEIEILPSPELEIYQGPELNCQQLTTTLTGFAWSGSGDYDFEWTTTNGNIVGGNNQETITINEPGTYNLLVFDLTSGCETASSFTATADIVLPAVNAGDDLPISCEITQPTIEGSGDPLNTISWTTFDGNIVSGGTTYNPIVDAPGLYFINVVHNVTGCTNIDSVEIIDLINEANANYQYQTSSLTMITTDMSTGSNLTGWSWTFGDGGTSNDQSPIHTYAAAGIYEVCLSVENGCGVSQTCSQVEVTSSGSVLNLDALVTNVLCNADSTGSIILVVNGGSGNYTYLWTGPGGTTYNTPSIEELIAGPYVVNVTDDQGNSILGGYNVDQPEVLLIGSSSVVDNLCFGQANGSITLTPMGGIAPYLYGWNGGPTQVENSIHQLPAGTHSSSVIDANGCTILSTYSVGQPSALASENIITDALCHGNADGTAAVTVSGGIGPYTYQWAGSANQTAEATGLVAGDYSVQVTDANSCVMNITIGISQPGELAVSIIEVIDATGVDQNDGSITVLVGGGTAPYIVTWSNGATGSHIEELLPGSYTYSIVDAHGCTLASASPIVINHSVATTEPDGSAYITITPNPSNGRVIIKWKELPTSNASLSVLTVDGRNVGAHQISTIEGTWDLTSLGLSEGLYIVLLEHNQQVYPFKLIVL